MSHLLLIDSSNKYLGRPFVRPLRTHGRRTDLRERTQNQPTHDYRLMPIWLTAFQEEIDISRPFDIDRFY